MLMEQSASTYIGVKKAVPKPQKYVNKYYVLFFFINLVETINYFSFLLLNYL